jgi:hypothetical protein
MYFQNEIYIDKKGWWWFSCKNKEILIFLLKDCNGCMGDNIYDYDCYMGSNAYYYNGHKGLKKFIRLVVW